MPLATQLASGQFSLVIPGTNDSITVQGEYFSNNLVEGTSLWWGQGTNPGTYVGVAAKSGQQLLVAQKGNAAWNIAPLSTRYNALVKSNTTVERQDIDVEPETLTPPGPDDCKFDTCQATFVVSIVLTPEALAVLYPNPNIQSWGNAVYLSFGLQAFNIALLDSGVSGKSIRFEYLNISSFNYSNAGLGPEYDMTVDLLTLNSVANNVRNLHQSDFVVMLTDSHYGNSLLGGALQSGGVSIIAANTLLAPAYTFAHEMGHLFGARHNRISNGGDADDTAECNYGYHSFSGYSLMAVFPAGASSLLAFSNPAQGTGTSKDNNADYLSGAMCKTQPYYRNTVEAQANIIGLEQVCNSIGSATYTAKVSSPGPGVPGNAPYTFSWKLGYNRASIIQTPVLSGSGPSFTVNLANLNIPSGQNYFWLHLTALTADGLRLTDMMQVTVVPCVGRLFIGQPSFAGQTFEVYPNPSHSNFNVRFEEPLSADVPYHIFNTLGQAIKTGNLPNGYDMVEIPFEALPGVYQLVFDFGNEKVIQKIVVNR